MARKQRRQRGMTLLEIMVVITILGLIAAAVGVSVMDQFGQAKQRRVKLDFGSLGQGLQLYAMKRGRLPDTSTGLRALVEDRILSDLPRDPWGNDYVYTLDRGVPAIVSLGADGAPGGDGDDTDLSSLDRDARSRE
ncbi:prepilin-type N-terminal cleavage/methylation domain-containing protein [Corallococcus exercitus]|uniref:Prepilin-type N-terminal cleavage/methylation domain-containing protein n=1 Tax=Corallococcus exercitus TaxID=2316736 RepID=A0A3A8H1C0_9BACT|nr:type II secretion system protein GspG [Corallococcus exercitus]NOK39395.1 prepilin-type N-terminal cleavage/methylation domain-containing protein [Corallococcus exercitus]RKG64892.1 prepilin-type N-terminal cleavage/methylation domain-containing protein [Corallococcus exercitus]